MEIENTNFTANSAYYEGGAIKWTMIKPIVLLSEKLFNKNSAGFYGDDIASYSQMIA